MIRTRPADASDRDFLAAMLVEAINWDPHGQPLAALVILSIPQNARYVEGWPRPGEYGVVAMDERNRRIGAAWWRRMPAEAPGYGFVGEHVPEVSIGVLSPHRARGVGTRLLQDLEAAAHAMEIAALSLSVETGNPARRLYARLGYEVVGRSGGAEIMVRDLGGPEGV